MTRVVVLFAVLFTAAALAAPADKSPSGEKSVKAEKADTADQAAKIAKPDKAKKPDKVDPAPKADKADKPGKAAPAEKTAPTEDPQSAYKALLQERDHLEQQKKILEWEEGLAAASLQDSAAYLVVDLDRQLITAKLGGVPMRHAPIAWRYERPGQAVVSGIFQVAERQADVPDSAVADSARTSPQPAVVGADSAKGDSALIDTSLIRLAATPRGPVPRHYDPQRRYCISLQGGPDLWLATLPPTQTRMDTLEVRLRTWIRDFPAVVQHRQSIHLFLEPADNYWIYAMAVLGARVLVIPPS
ncbi:MAG: hypothetical protein HYW07_10335 [Candidatus Latescibacteria bacterium]|nr:hypothetical protein [Candidatus Latescibacterota bacterium]